MSSTLPVLTTLCPICYTSPPKYRCPRCSMRTCSLECTQAHKLRASCSGVRDPTKFISKREFKPSTIDMDFNFLKTVEKSREEGHSMIKKVKKGTSKTRKRKLAGAKRKRGMRKARGRGIDVGELPEWMERRKENTVKWDSENERVLWTVEWNITSDEQTKTVIEHLIPDTAILEESFKSQGYEGSETHFLFRKHDQPANGSIYYRLQGQRSLLENLQGMTFMEFPTIYVVDTIPSTWTVQEPKR